MIWICSNGLIGAVVVGEAARDLLRLDEQARRRLVDRRQDRGDGDADRREQRQR